MKRDSFVFRGEWKDAIMGLPDAVRLEIYEAIIEYGTSGTIPTLKPTAMMAFNFMKMAIDRDKERYEERSEKAKKTCGFHLHFPSGYAKIIKLLRQQNVFFAPMQPKGCVQALHMM